MCVALLLIKDANNRSMFLKKRRIFVFSWLNRAIFFVATVITNREIKD